MNKKLNQIERIIIAVLYIIIMLVLFKFMGKDIGNVLNFSEDSSIWFYSGALLIVLGNYLTEPFFSKPTDTIANSISVILAILAINNKEIFVGYMIVLIFSIIMLVLSIVLIAIKDKQSKIKDILFFIVQKFGSAKILFSGIYLLAAYSYFANSELMKYFIISIALWICLVFFDVIGMLMITIKRLLKITMNKKDNSIIGMGISSKDISMYEIIVYDNKIKNYINELVSIYVGNNNFYIGIVINQKSTIDKELLEVRILQSNGRNIVASSNDLGYLKVNNNIFDKENDTRLVYIENISSVLKEEIEQNELYMLKNNLIGYISNESNINVIKFKIINEDKIRIKEGMIVQTYIQGKKTLYQIVDGITKSDDIEHSNTSYKIGIARKLGQYDYENKELKTINWLPNTFEPIYICEYGKIDEKKISNECIGKLPNTDMGIPLLDIDSLVTHNTAILGILGIGKSCLAYEIIKKVTDKNVKAICIDITNQYCSEKGLYYYLDENEIQNQIKDEYLEALNSKAERTGRQDNPSEWGNKDIYIKCMNTVIKEFIDSDKKILVINPDLHIVKKPLTPFKISELVEMTLVEKVRIISEELLKIAMERGMSDCAKYLIVYEEAHSLIPEWNSASNTSDQIASNGTAKVIMQGRKYGLGCLAITQRTANISKSILNQCNTIFALRIFDDTGKNFLENYIGMDYANILPTLEERHVVAVGKALKLKQPIILQLNNRENFKISESDDNIVKGEN